MQSYSHGPFEISGYSVTIASPKDEMDIIMAAWGRFHGEGFAERVTNKIYPGIHVVYYHYQHQDNQSTKSYDMLIGFMTEAGVMQSDPSITTLEIPAQNYRYVTLDDEKLIEAMVAKWQDINHMTHEELPRSFGYDLDMYNESGSQVTIAVSVF